MSDAAHGGGAVLYSRRGCSPCFAMRRAARRAARRAGLALRVIEISGDPELERLYGREVPVLVVPGGAALRGRADVRAIEAAFRRSAGMGAGRRRIGIIDSIRALFGRPQRPPA
jgi:hypothetical protein